MLVVKIICKKDMLKDEKKINIILCGGGTGGHIFPMIAIADELKILDKKIVLNSISLKWGLVKEEFKKRTKDLIF